MPCVFFAKHHHIVNLYIQQLLLCANANGNSNTWRGGGHIIAWQVNMALPAHMANRQLGAMQELEQGQH